MIPLLLVSLGAAVLHLSLGDSAQRALGKAKRDAGAQVNIANYYYWMALNVGDPAQQVEGFLDTGSSDFWVAAPGTCNTDNNGHLLFGTLEINCNYTYDASNSSTLARNQTDFTAAYMSGNSASGFFAQERVSIGGVSLNSINFGVATKTSASPAVGISYPYGEGCVVWNQDDLTLAKSSCQPYDNLPIQLKQQGVISTISYSLWLSSASVGTGSIVFGGLDHARYTGQLTKLPVEKEVYSFDHRGRARRYPEYTRLLVSLTGISIHGPQGSETIMFGAIPALLDSGTPTCMVPSAIVRAFYKVFGIYQGSAATTSVNCGIPDGYNISFDFRGFKVNVSLAEFIRPLLSSGLNTFDDQGNMLCSPGFESLDHTNYAIIGQNVLTSLYMVVDMEANEVALAASNPTPSSSSIESLTDQIPSATKAPGYSLDLPIRFRVAQSPSISARFRQATSIMLNTFDTSSETVSSEKQSGSNGAPQTSSLNSRVTTPSQASVPTTSSHTSRPSSQNRARGSGPDILLQLAGVII